MKEIMWYLNKVTYLFVYLHTQNTETVFIKVYTTHEIYYACVQLASGLYQSEIRRVLGNRGQNDPVQQSGWSV
jgi:hypothetical protein